MLQQIKRALLEGQVCRRGGRPERGHIAYEGITPSLVEMGIDVKPYAVHLADFESYVDRAGYSGLPYYKGGRAPGAREKYLEHFVSLDLMRPQARRVLIDIACMDSPFSEIVAELFGLKTYRQDLIYPPGMHGREIGGDAAALPVPDCFADYLTLHCSFEHFEGDSDSRFIREAYRVLKPGGKLCILPLYTNACYGIQTHIRGWRRFRAQIEAGDTVYIGERWGPPHARFYDARSLARRVVQHLGRFHLQIFEVSNLDACGAECYLRYAAVIEKPQ